MAERSQHRASEGLEGNPVRHGRCRAGRPTPDLARGSPVAQVFNLCQSIAAARGYPRPLAGRSSRPSRPRLTACPLRFAILAALAPIARSRAWAALAEFSTQLRSSEPRVPLGPWLRQRGLSSCSNEGLEFLEAGQADEVVPDHLIHRPVRLLARVDQDQHADDHGAVRLDLHTVVLVGE